MGCCWPVLQSNYIDFWTMAWEDTSETRLIISVAYKNSCNERPKCSILWLYVLPWNDGTDNDDDCWQVSGRQRQWGGRGWLTSDHLIHSLRFLPPISWKLFVHNYFSLCFSFSNWFLCVTIFCVWTYFCFETFSCWVCILLSIFLCKYCHYFLKGKIIISF